MPRYAQDADGTRRFAPDCPSAVSVTCPVCGATLTRRRSGKNPPHFGHARGATCELAHPVTIFEAAWQDRFPEANREVALRCGDATHVADVLVGTRALLIAHPRLSPADFEATTADLTGAGYELVWLFDLGKSTQATTSCPHRALARTSRLDTGVEVFLDLGEDVGSDHIVQVTPSPTGGFSSPVLGRRCSDRALCAHVGLADGSCKEPRQSPWQLPDAYLHFRERFGVTLNPAQERAASAFEGRTLVLAVPGSGKTTVLVSRLAYLTLELGVNPAQVAAITYTKSAAEDMRLRFKERFGAPEVADRIRFSTINALSLAIYREYVASRGESGRQMIGTAERARLLREAFARVRKVSPTESERFELESLISLAKNMMMDADAIASLDADHEGFSKMYGIYQAFLDERQLMDFDDQMLLAFEALGRDRTLWQRLRRRYAHWCVDEAQDTSRLQHNLIYRIVGRDGNLFMVGDEDQSIYGFRGAYPKALLDFGRAYASPLTLTMERNYRSGPEIIEAANRFVARNANRYDKHMIATRSAGSVVRTIEVRRRADQWQAALDLVEGAGEGNLAILYRDNDTAIPLVDLLDARGIPFRMLRGAKTFFDSHVVTDIRAFLTLALDPWDSEALMRVYYRASCYLRKRDVEWACRKSRRGGPDLLQALVDQTAGHRPRSRVVADSKAAERFGDLIESISGATPSCALDLLMTGGYGAFLKERNLSDRRVDICRAVARGTKTHGEFLARLDYLDRVIDRGQEADAACPLILSTIHSAKGLEFDRVLILDATDDIFGGTDDEEEVQEERRLFYVAMTRARDELSLMRVGQAKTSFIDEVIPRRGHTTKSHRPKGRRAGRRS